METVGIITVHHYGNYGSALQAYASQKVFEKLGYDTYIIDYRSPNVCYATDRYMDYNSMDDSYWRKLEKRKRGFVKRAVKAVLSRPHIAQFLYHKLGVTKGVDLNQFWLKNLKMTRRYNSLRELFSEPPHFDIYVVGGDQLWNTYITYNNPAYFLAFADKGAKKISFSTSIGIPHIPDEALPSFKKGMNNLSSILVREDEGVAYLRSMGYKAERVLDPTLMLTKEEWNQRLDKHYKPAYEKYILAYFLDPTDWTAELLETVRKQTGLSVIVIGNKQEGNPKTTGYTYTGNIKTDVFLSLFSNAEIVVTNSFHGIAFTLIFEKLLVATYRGEDSDVSMNSRHRNIVNMFELSSCLYDRTHFSTERINYKMNYDRIRFLMNEYKRQTIDLLKNALS